MSKSTRRSFVQQTSSLLAGGALLGSSATAASPTHVASPLPPHRAVPLEGVHLYTDRISVAAGEPLQIYTSATEPFELQFVRLGPDVDGPDSDAVIKTWHVDQPLAQPIHPGSYIHVAKGLPAEAHGSITIELWVRLWNADESQAIISQLNDNQGWALIVEPDATLTFFTGETETWAESPHRTQAKLSRPGKKVDYHFPPAAWHHVVATFAGGRKAIWLDGRLVGNWTISSPTKVANVPLRIGALGIDGRAGQFLDADIAQPAIYGRELNADEIHDHYVLRARTVYSEPGLLACWPLDEDRGCAVHDSGPHGRDGQIVNHATWMIGGPAFLPAVARYDRYEPALDPRRGHGLRLACDDLYDCAWQATHQVEVPASAKSGLYAVRARFTSDGKTFLRQASVVVKPAARAKKAPIAFLFATNTWKAYSAGPFCPAWPVGSMTVNTGGHASPPNDVRAAYSFYRHHRGGQPAYQMGWHVPWPVSDPHLRYLKPEVGYSHLARADRHTQVWLEREGYRYDAYADIDLHRQPELLADYRVLFIVGHSEYWTSEAMAAVRAFLDRGGHVVCLSGNTMYWRVSYDEAGSVIECRKSDAWGAQLGPASRGECWHEHDQRRGGVPRDDNQPGWRTLGVEFATNNLLGVPGAGPFRVVAPDHFLFHTPHELGLKTGEQFGADPNDPLRQPIGHEADIRVSTLMSMSLQEPPTGAPTDLVDPPGITLLAEGIVTAPMKLTARDYYHRIVPPPKRDGAQIACEVIHWQRPGGGQVFAAPSIAAGWTLAVDRRWAGLMKNVLHHFGVEPG
ncbi:MAG: LamG domain-containing protein [Planctomycetes bacterium]|nr:LamG domain-containing protein [Planctomycetota bacterium]